MKRDSNSSIIPKIIVFLGTVSVLGIILLFFRPRPAPKVTKDVSTPQKLFTQVMLTARPEIIKLWEEGDSFIGREGVQCSEEIIPSPTVGKSYYQCQPHFWQCYWQGGVKKDPRIKIDFFGQTYHLRALPRFAPIPVFSSSPRFYEAFKKTEPGMNLHVGYLVEFEIQEIPGITQPMILTDSCRDAFLPQRIYGQGKIQDKSEEGFIWDNFDRSIFIDKFYVTNQRVNEWRILTQQTSRIISDKKLWPLPAFLSAEEQKEYCAFYGKRVLEAKLFDAATMTPTDLKNPLPIRVSRPATPWQRDLSKTYLGMARINPDYQLTPLDCQLAQVKGCEERYFTTDSASWMGFHFALGFEQEHLVNYLEPSKNLKRSSRYLPASSQWHELGLRDHWKGEQGKTPVAFRCYEEVVP